MRLFSNKRIRGLAAKVTAFFVAVSFSFSTVIPPSYAQTFTLPKPGTMVNVSPVFVPPILKGIKIFSENPLKFDFILDTGNGVLQEEALKAEAQKLIKYFLASLTVPDEDLWGNLSPYEKDRIIPDKFGITEMGRDLLAQDYLLKQLSASMIYPEKDLGKRFWDRVHAKAQEHFGTVDIPVNTFNKVWIIPSRAVVYEEGDTAYVVESELKVMVEEDYLAWEKEGRKMKDDGRNSSIVSRPSSIGSDILKEIIIPEIEREVNNGENFTLLRQIYHSMILATWFKRNLRESVLGRGYVGGNKVSGVDVEDKEVKQKIYEAYLQAYQKGVYNYIKEDIDPVTQETIPRKYFSGGAGFGKKEMDAAMVVVQDKSWTRRLVDKFVGAVLVVSAFFSPVRSASAIAGNVSPPGVTAPAESLDLQGVQDPKKPADDKLKPFYEQRYPAAQQSASSTEKRIVDLPKAEREKLEAEYKTRLKEIADEQYKTTPDKRPSDNYVFNNFVFNLGFLTPSTAAKVLFKLKFNEFITDSNFFFTISYLEDGVRQGISTAEVRQLFEDVTGVSYSLDELLERANAGKMAEYLKLSDDKSVQEFSDRFVKFVEQVANYRVANIPFGFYRDLYLSQALLGAFIPAGYGESVAYEFLATLPQEIINNDRHRILAVGYLTSLGPMGLIRPYDWNKSNGILHALMEDKFGSTKAIIESLINDVEYGKLILEFGRMMTDYYSGPKTAEAYALIKALSREQIIEFIKVARQVKQGLNVGHLLKANIPYEVKISFLQWYLVNSEDAEISRVRGYGAISSGIDRAYKIVSAKGANYWTDENQRMRALGILAALFSSDTELSGKTDQKNRGEILVNMVGGIDVVLEAIRNPTEGNKVLSDLTFVNNTFMEWRLSAEDGLERWTIAQVREIKSHINYGEDMYDVLTADVSYEFKIEVMKALKAGYTTVPRGQVSWKAVYDIMGSLDTNIWSNDPVKKGRAMVLLVPFARHGMTAEKVKSLAKLIVGDIGTWLKDSLENKGHINEDELKNAVKLFNNPFVNNLPSDRFSKEEILKIHEATQALEYPSDDFVQRYWLPMVEAGASTEFLLTYVAGWKKFFVFPEIKKEQAKSVLSAYSSVDPKVFKNDEHRQNSLRMLLKFYSDWQSNAKHQDSRRKFILEQLGGVQSVVERLRLDPKLAEYVVFLGEIISNWSDEAFDSFRQIPQKLLTPCFELLVTRKNENVHTILSALSEETVPDDFKLAYLRAKRAGVNKFDRGASSMKAGYEKYLTLEDEIADQHFSPEIHDRVVEFFVDVYGLQGNTRLQLAIELNGGIEAILANFEKNPNITRAVLTTFNILPWYIDSVENFENWTVEQFMVVDAIYKKMDRLNNELAKEGKEKNGYQRYIHDERYFRALLNSGLSFDLQTAVMRYFAVHGAPDQNIRGEHMKWMGEIIEGLPRSTWRSDEHMVEAFLFLESIALNNKHANYSSTLVNGIFDKLGGMPHVLATIGTKDSLANDFRFIFTLNLEGKNDIPGLQLWTLQQYRDFRPKYEQFKKNTGATSFSDAMVMMKLLEEVGLRRPLGTISNFLDLVNDREAMAAQLTPQEVRGIFRLIGSPLLQSYFEPVFRARQSELEQWAQEILSAPVVTLQDINIPLYLLQRGKISREQRNQYLRDLWAVSGRMKNTQDQFRVQYAVRMCIASRSEAQVAELRADGLGDIVSASEALLPVHERPPYQFVIVDNQLKISFPVKDYWSESMNVLVQEGYTILPEQVNLDFTEEEFRQTGKNPQALLAAISAGTKIEFPASETAIQSLNNLLTRQDLYKILTQKASYESQGLIRKLAEGKKLEPWEMKRLNRLLIQENFSTETPFRSEKWYLTAKKQVNGVEVILYMHVDAERDNYQVFAPMADPSIGTVGWLGHSGQDGEFLHQPLALAPTVSREEQARKMVTLFSCCAENHYMAEVVSRYPATAFFGPSSVVNRK